MKAGTKRLLVESTSAIIAVGLLSFTCYFFGAHIKSLRKEQQNMEAQAVAAEAARIQNCYNALQDNLDHARIIGIERVSLGGGHIVWAFTTVKEEQDGQHLNTFEIRNEDLRVVAGGLEPSEPVRFEWKEGDDAIILRLHAISEAAGGFNVWLLKEVLERPPTP